MNVLAALLLVFSLFDLRVFGSQSSSQHATSDWALKFENFSAGPFLREGLHVLCSLQRKIERFGPRFDGLRARGRTSQDTLLSRIGAAVRAFVVLDVTTGRVYDTRPFDFIDVPFQGASSGRAYEGLVYKPGSRLFIADGCPENGKCGNYYEWKNSSFTLLRFDPLGPSTK